MIAANTPPLHTGCEVICSQRNYTAKARNKKLRLHPKYPELLSPRNNFFKEPRGSFSPLFASFRRPPLQQDHRRSINRMLSPISPCRYGENTTNGKETGLQLFKMVADIKCYKYSTNRTLRLHPQSSCTLGKY